MIKRERKKVEEREETKRKNLTMRMSIQNLSKNQRARR
jgi:hypothetical protein